MNGLAVAVLVGEVLGRGFGDARASSVCGVSDRGVLLGVVLEGDEFAQGAEVNEVAR